MHQTQYLIECKWLQTQAKTMCPSGADGSTCRTHAWIRPSSFTCDLCFRTDCVLDKSGITQDVTCYIWNVSPAAKDKNIKPASWRLVIVIWFGNFFLSDLSNYFCLERPNFIRSHKWAALVLWNPEKHLAPAFTKYDHGHQGELPGRLHRTHSYAHMRLHTLQLKIIQGWMTDWIFNSGK